MKMQEKKLKRFDVYAKIANVLFIIAVVGGALLIAAGIGGAVFLNVTDFDLAKAANFIFDNELPGAKLILPDDFQISFGVVSVIILNMTVALAMTAFVIKSVALMFKNTVTQGTPFNPKSVRNIKNIGWAFLIYVGTEFVLSIATGMMSSLGNFNMRIDGRSFLIGLLIISLGEMFEFGKNLQEDNESIL